MNEYSRIFSKDGLIAMISGAKEELINKQKEYQDVYDGKKYNPKCRECWLKTIKEDIKNLENDIRDYEEALQIKQSEQEQVYPEGEINL